MSRHDTDRERRLAAALRENLRRRKAQARGAETGAPAEAKAENKKDSD
jgi:hypothetical protein